MNHTTLATSKTPALVIYLLDISASMDKRLGKKSRLETAMDALNAAIRTMVFRSSKGRRIQPRYRLAIYAYSNEVYDLLGGIRTIDEVAQMKLPAIGTRRGTDTARAFAAAGELIGYELPHMQTHPAPLVCHLTDDRYTGDDPEPIVKAIMRMGNQDGHVLVENIYISDQLGNRPGQNALAWTGIQANSPLADDYGRKLRSLSSPLPPSYHTIMQEMGSKIEADSVMMFPGNTPDLISLGFQMSSATGVGRGE
ncbi:MAG: VWA domain-containing protein [Chloroflexi bacterium]|nr:VWA domain-containing protein [Chloroflexota bacterium]MCI0577916.1 VWA domain-containing protein [Chloroflexota bacterium]MCI0645796.1 VWA domain-containing protein [Chloroflexota bacterium]MCI0727265.1 VWA domain-containing protein [Chloroflexota bacterium]